MVAPGVKGCGGWSREGGETVMAGLLEGPRVPTTTNIIAEINTHLETERKRDRRGMRSRMSVWHQFIHPHDEDDRRRIAFT